MYIFDEDSANIVCAENRQQAAWEQHEKNRILRMTNSERKQKEWNYTFPKVAPLTEAELLTQSIY